MPLRTLRDLDLLRHMPPARWSIPRSAQGWARSSPRGETARPRHHLRAAGPAAASGALRVGASAPVILKAVRGKRGALMDRIETDICIIGAGSAGLSVAAGAAPDGARVVLDRGAPDGRRLPEFRLRAVQGVAGRGAQGARDGAGPPSARRAMTRPPDFGKAKDHVPRRDRPHRNRSTARSGSRGAWASA